MEACGFAHKHQHLGAAAGVVDGVLPVAEAARLLAWPPVEQPGAQSQVAVVMGAPLASSAASAARTSARL